MTRLLLLTAFALLALLGCLAQPEAIADEPLPHHDGLTPAQLSQQMATAAQSLLQSGAPRLPLQDPERFNWDYWPSRYPGLRTDQAQPAQRTLANRLLHLALSQSGLEKLRLIQAIEPYNPYRSPYYSLQIFGDPTHGQPWAWRYQGHHLSLNFTLAGQDTILTTPLFLGSQPLSHPSIQNGQKPLRAEEETARQLYLSLNDSQRQKAKVRRPGATYLPLKTKQPTRHTQTGIPMSDLTPPQKQQLTSLIKAYIQPIAPNLANQIQPSEWKTANFGWSGSARPNQTHYYRIQTKNYLFEHDNRDRGNHIHQVWRTYQNDFGQDLLAKHLANHH